MKLDFIKQLLHGRLIWTAICVIPLMALTHHFFGDTRWHGLYPEQVIAEKLAWHHNADWIFAGDSRVYLNVSPQAIAKIVPGQRILNFAFSGNCWSDQYLDSIENVLDPQSNNPVILIGINPYGFTLRAQRQNGFQSAQEKQHSPSDHLDCVLEPVLIHLQPLPILETFASWIKNQPLPSYNSECFADGFQAFVRQPLEPHLLLTNGYVENLYRGNEINPDLLRNFLNRVDRWHRRGITVYGFRPPLEPQTLALEIRLSDFDDDDFIRNFTTAGGIWLNIENAHEIYGPRTYDGQHLPGEQAQNYSHDLARKILEHQP